MGKGKGNFKRWCTIVYPGRVFIEHLNTSPRIYTKYLSKVNIKLKIQLKMLHITSSAIKGPTINGGLVSFSDQFAVLRVRNTLYT